MRSVISQWMQAEPQGRARRKGGKETDPERKCKTKGCDNHPDYRQFLCGPCKQEHDPDRPKLHRQTQHNSNTIARAYAQKVDENTPLMPYPSAKATFEKMLVQVR